MPIKPGTSAEVTIDPTATHQNPNRTVDPASANQVSSTTWNPFYGLEVGRDGTPPATTLGGGGNDTL
jgi:hypothetical protein